MKNGWPLWCYFSRWWWEGFAERRRDWRRAWCWIRGHHGDVIWYSSGYEPDLRCQDCGEDLG